MKTARNRLLSYRTGGHLPRHVLRLFHMYPATESKAKVVYKEPPFVIDEFLS